MTRLEPDRLTVSQITVGIGNEVRDGNLELTGMVSDMIVLSLSTRASCRSVSIPSCDVPMSGRSDSLYAQNDAFGSASNFLNGTFRRMSKMAKRQGIGWCWFMLFLLFVLWVFVIVWWLRR